MTLDEIKARKAELDAQGRELRKKQDHLKVEYQHLHLDCPHTNKYSSNTWGRDPGGAECPDCGKSW